jgi:hypothetical protein
MSNEKFIQGEWVASVSRFRTTEDHPWTDICWGVGSGGFSIVSEVNGGGTLDMNLGQMSEICEANAYLIAAAPEMYHALKSMVDMIDCGDEHGEGIEWHKEATKALTKARGES